MDEPRKNPAPRPTGMNAEPRVPESRYWPTRAGTLAARAVLELIYEKKAALDAKRASADAEGAEE